MPRGAAGGRRRWRRCPGSATGGGPARPPLRLLLSLPAGRGAAAGGSWEEAGGTHDTRYYVTDPFNRGSRPPPGPAAAPRHPPAGRSPLRGGGGAGGAGVHLPQARASGRFLALQAERGSPRGQVGRVAAHRGGAAGLSPRWGNKGLPRLTARRQPS